MSASRLAALVLLGGAATAAAARPLDFQTHGFASQGFVLSDGNNVNGPSDRSEGSTEFRELGVNASWRPLGTLLFAGQMAGVESGGAIDEEVVVEYALADYAPFQGEWGRFGARLGKLKLPIGLYNDARDNIFTRPGVILPNSVYLETNGSRAFGYYALQGAALYSDWFAGDHAVYAEVVAAGAQELGDNAEIPILRSPASGEFDLERGVVLRVMDEYGGGRWRAALSVLTADLVYEPNGSAPSPANPFTQRAGLGFDQAVLSLQYNGARFGATAEVVARHIELTDISPLPIPTPPFNGTLKQDPVGYYLQGSWRFDGDWQAFLRYDEQIRDWNDRHGREQSAAPVIGLPRHYYFARDWTAGTRYDVFTNLALWAEVHYVDGVGWVNPLDNPGFGSGSADRYWTLFTAMLGYRF